MAYEGGISYSLTLHTPLCTTQDSLIAKLTSDATLKTLLDTGSQLARDRFVTGLLTGRRSLFQYLCRVPNERFLNLYRNEPGKNLHVI